MSGLACDAGLALAGLVGKAAATPSGFPLQPELFEGIYLVQLFSQEATSCRKTNQVPIRVDILLSVYRPGQ